MKKLKNIIRVVLVVSVAVFTYIASTPINTQNVETPTARISFDTYEQLNVHYYKDSMFYVVYYDNLNDNYYYYNNESFHKISLGLRNETSKR